MKQKADQVAGGAAKSLPGLRLLLGHIFYPFDRAIVAAAVRSYKYEELRIQECRFYGGKEFLLLCGKALEMLKGFDTPLYESLVRAPNLFWNEPSGTTWSKLACGIGPEHVVWKGKGIITCVVHTCIRNELIYAKSTRLFRKKAIEAIKQKQPFTRTYDWLKKHEFPKELLSPFSVNVLGATGDGMVVS